MIDDDYKKACEGMTWSRHEQEQRRAYEAMVVQARNLAKILELSGLDKETYRIALRSTMLLANQALDRYEYHADEYVRLILEDKS